MCGNYVTSSPLTLKGWPYRIYPLTFTLTCASHSKCVFLLSVVLLSRISRGALQLYKDFAHCFYGNCAAWFRWEMRWFFNFFSWFCLWGQGFSFIYLEKTNWAEKGNLFTSPLWLFWLLQYRQKLFGDVWVFSLCVLVSIYVAQHITKYVYWCQYKRGFKFLLDFCAEPNDNRLCKKLVLDYCMLHIEMPIRI